jgi:putative membrane protein
MNLKHYLGVVFKGICMGAADVVPGVSGGTIAFLMGIYQELIDSIRSVNATAIKLFFSGKFAEFWKHINGNFLCSVFIGILISVFTLAKLMQFMLEFYPIHIWSFFFGLVLASAIYILKGLDKWNLKNILSLLVGIGIAAFICLASPAETPNEYWFVFLSGAIAICAMILPGISGSFILLLLGKYAFVMEAVSTLNIPVISVFGCGAIVGILSFSHFLGWLLKKFYMQTIALLSGFMIGSLLKVWPWKNPGVVEGVDFPTDPFTYEQISGAPSLIGYSIICALFGLVIVFGIEYLAVKAQKNK